MGVGGRGRAVRWMRATVALFVVAGVGLVAVAGLAGRDPRLWRATIAVDLIVAVAALVVWTRAVKVAAVEGFTPTARPRVAAWLGMAAAGLLVLAVSLWDVDAAWWRATMTAVFVVAVAALVTGAPPPPTGPTTGVVEDDHRHRPGPRALP